MIARTASRLGLSVALFTAFACSNNPASHAIVAVTPASVSVVSGETQQFTSQVVGSSVTAVTWSVTEGASGGSVDATGLYTAPAGVGTFHVVATSVSDTAESATATVTVVAAEPVTTIFINPSAASVKTSATFQFTAQINGANSSAVIWTVAAGGAGGTISQTGLYTAPLVTGRDAVIATATAETTKSYTAAVTVTLSPTPVLTYATSKLTCTIGVACNLPAPESSGGAIVSLAIAPALPPGLIFNASTGAISGTPTRVTALATYDIIATNAGGSSGTPLAIAVNDISPLQFGYSANGLVCTSGQPCTLAAPTNLGGAITSFTVAPALPAGLTLNANGSISGTSTVVTAPAPHVITAKNSGGSATAILNVSVVDAAPATPGYAAGGLTCTLGVACATAAPSQAGGGAVTSYSISPTLPAGLALDPVTGIVSGTPTAVSPSQIYVVLANNSGGSAIADLGIVVNDLAPANLAYKKSAFVCVKGTPCPIAAPTSTGGTVLLYAANMGLPAGLSIDPDTGAISGTPTAVTAATSFTITASNSGGSTSDVIMLTVNDIAPTALTYSPSSATCTETKFCTFGPPTNSGGTPVSYSISPALPAGLSLSPTTGLINGTPVGTSTQTSYQVTATNTGGFANTNISITVLLAAPENITYSPSSLVCADNIACSLGAPSNSGGAVATFTSDPLPQGLSINASSGAITGTPASGVIQGATTYNVTATNSAGSASTSVSITITASPPAAPANLTYPQISLTCEIGLACSLGAPTSGGGAVQSYSVSPALPAGLTFSAATGAISGTPTATSAVQTYTATALNAGGTSTETLSITVLAQQAWTALGPQGGEAIQLAITPDSTTLFAVMRGGSIYRSTDAAAHWTPVTGSLLTAGPSFVDISPMSATTLYAATGSGFFSSSDSGNTWTQLGYTGQGLNIAADPFTAGTLYGGTTDAASVYVSTDNGQTFVAATTVDPADPAQVFADPNNPGVVYAQQEVRVFKSINSGASWFESDTGIPPTTGGLGDLAIDPAQSSQLYVTGVFDNTVYVSSNSGASWTSHATGLAANAYPESVFVDPSLHTRVYLATAKGAYVSADSGLDWAAFGVVPASAEPVGVATNGTIYASDPAGIYVSSNGGSSWQPDVTGLTATEIFSVAAAPDGTLYATGNPGTFVSKNQGQSWTSIDGAAGLQILVDPASPTRLIELRQDQFVQTSQDGGATWTVGQTGNVASLAIPPAGGGAVYAGLTTGAFAVSADDGRTFSVEGAPLLGGEAGANSASIHSIAVLDTNATMLVGVALNAVFYSADSGQTWMPSSGLNDTGLRAAVGTNGLFYLASDTTLYVSNNGGQSFSQQGVPPSGASGGYVTNLSADPVTHELYISGSPGLYKTADGVTYTSLNAGLITSLAATGMAFSNGLIFVATVGGGVLVSASGGL